MSGLQALVSGGDCSGTNSLNSFVKQLDGRPDLDLARQGFAQPPLSQQQRHRPTTAAFHEDDLAAEFLQAGPAGSRLRVQQNAGPSALESALREQHFSAHPNWTEEFGEFRDSPNLPPDVAELENAFQRASLNQHHPQNWAQEFGQKHHNVPLTDFEHREFEKAFAQHQVGGAMEDAFSREFAAIQSDLIPLKGKQVANDEISWQDEFAKNYQKDVDMEKLEGIFEKISASNPMSDWQSEFERYDEYDGLDNNEWSEQYDNPDPILAACPRYVFESDNPYLSHPNPFEEGIRLMANRGNLSEIALAFEAAVQRDPDNTVAWTKLGTVQAENEKEAAAISALHHSVQLDPGNSEGLLALAVSYTNEWRKREAYATLERWVLTRYPDIGVKADNYDDIDALHQHVSSLFIAAARQGSDTNLDADVQIGLGVLFHSTSEFDKAIDCFKAALSLRPDDYLLWNRLGATQANLGDSEIAIDAYYKALELNPAFVRGWYNLAVSCINIGCYKEAAEHLLGALSMHSVGGNKDDQNVSNNLWETLRRAFVMMERRDLADRTIPGQDLSIFRKDFDFRE
ncbi:hypothetical protein DFS34DRAFT_464518 [Phlyctochytrium arcticum]|nr:hypothetical protein DFS34DRAFT_464518 [Phlyctochytrium arcticum]